MKKKDVQSNSSITPGRAHSLDALRGFAILTMVLSGVVPFGILPSWMYHAQIPPPEHTFNPDLAGLTWVDLVFPFFLFALGAAIPLALGKRLNKGGNPLSLVPNVLERGFLLGFFAIFLPHMRPDKISSPVDTTAQLLGLFGFLLMFAMFLRFPNNWNRWIKRLVRALGWTAAIALLYFLPFADQQGFSLYRSNIILIVLTNVYIFGSLLWLVSRNNMLLRLGFLGILLGLRLAHDSSGWIQSVWNFSPAPWIYKMYYLQYLFIVIPGTIIGDLLAKRGKELLIKPAANAWKPKRLILLTGLLTLFIPLLLVGLQGRWLWQTTTLSFILILVILRLTTNAGSERDHLLRTLCNWGSYFLILGLIFEPFEGGIKKDHSTLSYYFITTGLAVYLLTVFSIMIDILKKQKWFRLLIDNGQNPMIAYVAMAHFIFPLLDLSGVRTIINDLSTNPWTGVIRALFYTFILSLLVSFFTRKKLFWRT